MWFGRHFQLEWMSERLMRMQFSKWNWTHGQWKGNDFFFGIFMKEFSSISRNPNEKSNKIDLISERIRFTYIQMKQIIRSMCNQIIMASIVPQPQSATHSSINKVERMLCFWWRWWQRRETGNIEKTVFIVNIMLLRLLSSDKNQHTQLSSTR